jgi:TIR domain
LEDVFLCSALAVDVIEAKLAQHRPEANPTAAPSVVHNAAHVLKMMICYSHSNKAQRKQIDKHLALMTRQKLIDIWYDRKITAGSEWNGYIDEHINTSDIILLLISAEFIASDYCFDVEMTRALERHKAGEARVIPVILRKCDWKNTSLKDLQALPSNVLPVDQWPRSNDAYHDIADGIRKVVEELHAACD